MPSASTGSSRQFRRHDVVYLTLVLFVAWLTVHFGQIEFGSYDSSMLIDTGWRMAHGQVPMHDFPSMLPPTFLVLAGAAVRLFGAHWSAFTRMGALVYMAVALLGWAIIRSGRLPLRQAAYLPFAFLTAISLPQLVTGHVWHAVIASMLAVTLLLTYVVEALRAQSDPSPRTFPVLLLVLGTIASAGLWASKPNIALVALASSILFPLVQARRRGWLAWLVITCSGLALACAAVRLAGLHPLAIAHSYATVGERPKPLILLYIFFNPADPPSLHIDSALVYAFAVLAPIPLWAILWLFRRVRNVRIALPLALSGMALTWSGLLTNWDIRSNDLGPLTFAALVVISALFSYTTQAQQALRTALTVLCIQACLLCLFNERHRTRMVAVGVWAGIPYGKFVSRNDAFFGHFLARERFWNAVDAIDQDLAQHPNNRVFFGPRLEFEYARTGRISPVGLPIWWHRGSAYPVSQESELIARWIGNDYQTVYLPTDDRLPSPIFHILQRDYTMQVVGPSQMMIFHKRNPAASR